MNHTNDSSIAMRQSNDIFRINELRYRICIVILIKLEIQNMTELIGYCIIIMIPYLVIRNN